MIYLSCSIRVLTISGMGFSVTQQSLFCTEIYDNIRRHHTGRIVFMSSKVPLKWKNIALMMFTRSYPPN